MHQLVPLFNKLLGWRIPLLFWRRKEQMRLQLVLISCSLAGSTDAWKFNESHAIVEWIVEIQAISNIPIVAIGWLKRCLRLRFFYSTVAQFHVAQSKQSLSLMGSTRVPDRFRSADISWLHADLSNDALRFQSSPH